MDREGRWCGWSCGWPQCCAQPPARWAATSLRTSSTVSTFPLGSVAESNSDQMSSSTALARLTNSALSRKTRSTSRPVRKLRNLSFQSIHSPPSAWLSIVRRSDSPVSPCSPSTDALDGKRSTLKGEQITFPAEMALRVRCRCPEVVGRWPLVEVASGAGRGGRWSLPAPRLAAIARTIPLSVA